MSSPPLRPKFPLLHSTSNSVLRWFMCLACQPVDLWPVCPSPLDHLTHKCARRNTQRWRDLTKTKMSQQRNEEASSCCHREGADEDTPLLHTSARQTQCERHFLLAAKADHEFMQLLDHKTKEKKAKSEFDRWQNPGLISLKSQQL